jgi:hypothetical protein
MRRPQHHAKPVMTVGQSTVQLRMLLVGCSDNALASFTPDYLASSYRVKPAEASLMLTEQRAHRASRT